MKKKKNAFTLIELLAIIVILAIIAVITVPIILNIIENSRKGAATDSAYGYKDSVNKYYISELQNHNKLKLDGKYTVNSNGSLTPAEDNTFGFGDENVTSFPVQVSGTVPSSGELTYDNNILKSGYLVIGDYRVTFNQGGTVTTVKNSGSSSNEQGNGGQSSSVPTIATCPGCKFIFTTSQYGIIGREYNSDGDMPPAADLTNDYRNLQKEVDIWIADDDTEYYDEDECIEANNDTDCESRTTSVQRTYFLGLIESTSDSTKIGRAFACGIENDTPFCLEGYDPSKYSDDDSDDDNIGILNTIFPECGASGSYAGCSGPSVGAFANDNGHVGVYDDYGYCYVESDGDLYCSE